jgi:hypothetical protein
MQVIDFVPSEKYSVNRDKKFDLQLSDALIDEKRLGDIFAAKKIEKIELKTEEWQWEKTGNICIEFRWRGAPSGIAITEADYWVHELTRSDNTLCYLMFPIERLKELCRVAYKAGDVRFNVGDNGYSDVILLKLKDILN